MSAPQIEPFAIVGRAFERYREHFAVLFPVALIIGLIDAIIGIGLGEGGAAFLALAVSLVISMLFQGLVVELVRDIESGAPERSVGELVRSVWPIVPALLAVSLLAAMGIVVGLFLLVVPGLFLITIWAVAAPALVIERRGVSASFARSRELVRGSGWPVLGVMLLTMLVIFAGSLVASAFGVDPDSAGGRLFQLVAIALISPIPALAVGILYFRLIDVHAASAEAEETLATTAERGEDPEPLNPPTSP